MNFYCWIKNLPMCGLVLQGGLHLPNDFCLIIWVISLTHRFDQTQTQTSLTRTMERNYGGRGRLEIKIQHFSCFPRKIHNNCSKTLLFHHYIWEKLTIQPPPPPSSRLCLSCLINMTTKGAIFAVLQLIVTLRTSGILQFAFKCLKRHLRTALRPARPMNFTVAIEKD